MNDIKIKPRSAFWLTRFLDNFGGKRFWTTIGDTIYYPESVKDPYAFPHIIEHERVHLEQYKKYGTIPFLFLYALVPLPMFFSYFRWKFEREAYLGGIKKYGDKVDDVVNLLWWGYGFPWPKFLMRKWFLKQLNKK